ncbi:MAG: hypothetical protein ACLUSP_06515 [Christensenellales bacterium]
MKTDHVRSGSAATAPTETPVKAVRPKRIIRSRAGIKRSTT